MAWGEDNGSDRIAGKRAEDEAAGHLRERGFNVIPHPMGETGFDLLIDGDPPRLCEVRAKGPDHKNRYGLEAWKVPLWTAADVIYLVKDTKRKGWFAASMRKLPPPEDGRPGSYKAGEFDKEIPNAYWSIEHWQTIDWPYTVGEMDTQRRDPITDNGEAPAPDTPIANSEAGT